jgi:outer membrane lipoprotein-sorting protein
MCRFFVLFLILAGPVFLGAQSADGLTAEALLAKLDRNQTSATGHALGSVTVEDRFGTKVTTFESWSRGKDSSLVVFTSGEDKGQKILRLKDTIYVAYPEADKPVKIQGAALKDSVGGSDLSYEDMAGDTSLVSRFSAVRSPDETVAGELCAVLELTATKPGLAYPFQKVWVALKDFSPRKSEKYSQNKRLLKTEEVLAVSVVAGRTITTKAVLADAVKVKSKTTFELTKVELDGSVDARKFSLEELTW